MFTRKVDQELTRVFLPHLVLKVKSRDIMQAGLVVQAVLAVTLDRLRVIPKVMVPLQMDQMQGSHLGHESIWLRTLVTNVLNDYFGDASANDGFKMFRGAV